MAHLNDDGHQFGDGIVENKIGRRGGLPFVDRCFGQGFISNGMIFIIENFQPYIEPTDDPMMLYWRIDTVIVNLPDRTVWNRIISHQPCLFSCQI